MQVTCPTYQAILLFSSYFKKNNSKKTHIDCMLSNAR